MRGKDRRYRGGKQKERGRERRIDEERGGKRGDVEKKRKEREGKEERKGEKNGAIRGDVVREEERDEESG